MSISTQQTKHKITATEFFQMGRFGILKENARIELLDGDLIEMAPISPEHSFAVSGLHTCFAQKLAGKAYITSQNPIVVNEVNVPQPDIVIAKWSKDYANRHPGPADIELIVEVASTSLGYDRGAKRSLYAQHGVTEYWILNLNDGTVERYLNPDDGLYTRFEKLDRVSRLSPAAFPDVVIDMKEVLGR
jgi:Uma2 family endonuclease